MLTFEQRRDMIATHVWETWTTNGLGLDDEARAETTKTVSDAVNNVYVDDIDDIAWIYKALKRLGPDRPWPDPDAL